MRIKKGIAFAVGLTVAATLHHAPAFSAEKASKPSLKELLSKARCAKAARELSEEWGAAGDWKRQADPEPGTKAYRSTAKETGTTIEFRLSAAREIEALRVSSGGALRVTWKESCEPMLGVARRTASVDPATGLATFTDVDVKQLLDGGKTGVIYAWSPHMPLSLKALPEIRKAARSQGVELIYVLDSYADQDMARKDARENGLGEDALRRIDSIELEGRNLRIHYPAVLVYHKGRLLNEVLPGFKEAEIYEKFIKLQQQQAGGH